MRYPSFKRVFGETNIERKCLILFGICMLSLVSLTFWGVYRITRGLISEVQHQIGQNWAELSVYEMHFSFWTGQDAIAFVEVMRRDLITQRYEWKQMMLQDDEVEFTEINPGILPENERERQQLQRLFDRWKVATASGDEKKPKTATTPADPKSAFSIDPKMQFPLNNKSADFEEWYSSEDDTYYHYTPVIWRESCTICHKAKLGDATSLAGIAPDAGLATPPFRVIRIAVPGRATNPALIWTSSLLISLAIVTVGLATLGLYVIVRYVVIRPLNHLRDVSDEISRGNTAMRADIQTNDEFEELGTAFNKMLRHLTDAQNELRTVNVDLDNRLDQLAQLNMRLYEMNRLKDDFMANMSHELRTPLNSIIGFSEVLQGIDSLNDKQKRYAQNIQKSGRILLDMINDILDLAKMEAGKMDVRPTEFRVDAVIAAQCDMVRSLTEEKNIDLTLDIAPELPAMYQDQSKVQQILTNLLSNAIKFTPEGGIIKVTVRRLTDGNLEMRVADTGVGIAEEDREVIFEKFRQSRAVLGNDGLTRAYSGTGLGLSIVKELCKLLGGEISVESELGKGSTFRVELPWTLPNQPQLESRINAKLNELNKPRREFTVAGSDP